MQPDKIKINTCRYRVERLQLNIPTLSKPYRLDTLYISSMEISKEFDAYIFPYFEITITVPNHIARAMRKSKNDVTCNLELTYAMYAPDQGDYVEDKFYKKYLNKTFMVYTDDMTPDLNEKLQEEYESSIDISDDRVDMQNVTSMKIILYNQDYLMNTKKIINAVISGGTLTDSLLFTLNKAGINNILLSPANNNSRPSEFILIPVTAMEEIEYICNNFGMHTNGTMIFFDLERGYIIDKNYKCTAWAPNEYKTTYLVSFGSNNTADNMESGCYKDTTNRYNVCNLVANSITVVDSSYANEQLRGNNLIYTDINGNSKVISTSVNSKVGGISGSVNNQFGVDTSSAIKYSIEESKSVITVSLEGCHIDFLTPNKEFILSMDDPRFSKLNGKYRMSSQKTMFKKDGKDFLPYTVCTLMGGFK